MIINDFHIKSIFVIDTLNVKRKNRWAKGLF